MTDAPTENNGNSNTNSNEQQDQVAAMTLWVDADAAPNAMKDVIFRAAERLRIPTVLVANQYIRTPPSKVIKAIQVAAGFDVADNAIVEALAPGDLVITADIPLADEVITKGGAALNPRGMLYTKENIKDRLSRRDMMEELRSAGPQIQDVSGGPKPLDKKDVQAFANALDRYLTMRLRALDAEAKAARASRPA